MDGQFTPPQGNREALTYQERDLLENTVLPTARRWVQKYPGLADHGRQTLAYWGEPAPMDRGAQ